MFLKKNLINKLTSRLLALNFHLSDKLRYNNFFFFQFLYYYSSKITIINLYNVIFILKKLFPMLIFFLKNSGLFIIFDFLNLNYFYQKNIFFLKRMQIYQNWVIGTFDNPIIFFSILQNFSVIFEFLKAFILFFTIPPTKLVLLTKLWKLNLPIIAFINSNLILKNILYIIPLTIKTEMQNFFFLYLCQILLKYFHFFEVSKNSLKFQKSNEKLFNYKKFFYLKKFKRKLKKLSKNIIKKRNFRIKNRLKLFFRREARLILKNISKNPKLILKSIAKNSK